ncbi:MAG: PQQ-dependent sugar dehydrogenase [Bythopirellula sp.]|nr:PQQ-dependent sugar dehydrogenase [Bythopirellula sp.]
MKMLPVVIALVLTLGAAEAGAQLYPSPIPISTLEIGIRDVARLPSPGSGNMPRMSVATRDPLGRLMVNDQRGPMYTVNVNTGAVVEYFDIRDYAGTSLTAGGEVGVQGFAFHPDFNTPAAPGFGRFYTFHSSTNTAPAPDFTHNATSPAVTHHEVLLEWRTNDPTAPTFTPADSANPYRDLMRFEKRFGNHNGGNVSFSPLGGADRNNLYIAMGDGGGGGDPFNAGQDKNSAFGKLLRIDPLGTNSANGEYGIVADNVFAADGNSATLGEVYSYGLRNPQRFGWDTTDGNLYIADIGQDTTEELNLAVNGGNFGWDVREGFGSTAGGFLNPVAEYRHSVAVATHPSPLPSGFALTSDAITTGEVYRGTSLPQLDGILLAGDFPKGLIYMLDVDTDPLDGGGEGLTELIPVNTSTGQERRLISLINAERASLGLDNATRADLRFSVNTPGEVFILNKQDGVLRMLVPLIAPGDFDEDGDVDGRDFLVWQRGQSPEPFSSSDLATWQTNYGTGPLAASVAVPEPTSLAMVGLALMAASTLRRNCFPQ